MKVRTAVLSCLISVVVLSMGYEYSRAGPKADEPSLKIGVVSIEKIFRDCERSTMYRKETIAERNRIEAELDKLVKEIEADQAGLRTLKAGSSDHLASLKEIMEKQAKLQAQQEFHKLQMALKEQRMIEEIYKDILRETSGVAEQKGLDLVFEKSEPEFSSLTPTQLELTIATHKLLYSGGCLDITDEVMARLDKEK